MLREAEPEMRLELCGSNELIEWFLKLADKAGFDEIVMNRRSLFTLFSTEIAIIVLGNGRRGCCDV